MSRCPMGAELELRFANQSEITGAPSQLHILEWMV